MPALIVRDLVSWLARYEGSLVAGSTLNGQDRSIEGISRPLRIIPRELELIEVHDIVLVSYAIFTATTDSTLADLITELADTQAALLVAGLPVAEQRAREAADRAGLPLIGLPDSIDLRELEREITALLRQQQAMLTRTLREVTTAIGRARQADNPLDSLARALAEATGLAFVLEDEHRVPLLRALPTRFACSEDEIIAALASYAARQAVRPATPGGAGQDVPLQRHLPGKLSRAIIPLRSGLTPIAYLSLVGPEQHISSITLSLLWQIGPTFAFALGNQRKETVKVRVTAADDLAALLNGTVSEAEGYRRAMAHHCDLSQPHVVVVLAPVQMAGDKEHWAREQVAKVATTYWVLPGTHGLHAVLRADDALLPRVEQLSRLIGTDHALAIGVGSASTGVLALQMSNHQAISAMRANQVLRHGGITRYEMLGVLELLYPLQESQALERFCEAQLGPILRADPHQGDQLLRTLDAWFAVHGNSTEAARQLGIHRNTLMYRINRIEDVLHNVLDDPDKRLALQIALKIWQFTRTP